MPYLNDMFNAQNAKRLEEEAIVEDQAAQVAAGPVTKDPPPPGVFDTNGFAARVGSRVLGQNQAIEAVTRAVSLASVGMTDPHRPLANILLVGPTGVGKTELVRQIASELRSGPDDLCRIDMNALAQEHYAASLSGAPPGYAGSKENFSLFDRSKIEGDPYTPGIVLFDEVEKAHPTVIRTLLQIMDNGTLRLASGQETISFRNCYLFMTSNLGSTKVARRRSSRRHAATRYLQSLTPGMAAAIGHQTDEDIFRGSVKNFFDIELLNRIDETVVFSDLDEKTAHRIARNELHILRTRLARKSIELHIEDDVIKHVVNKGFDPVFGARSLRRVIRSQVAATVADCVLSTATSTRHKPIKVIVHTEDRKIAARLHEPPRN
ncbi:MAG: AAA family ATPase [Pseudarthrobacter sp.]